ncbi:hypothetical protein DMH17_03690 [Raoultella planticola]|nr:hypothetical protein [Raoultella planticola]
MPPSLLAAGGDPEPAVYPLIRDGTVAHSRAGVLLDWRSLSSLEVGKITAIWAVEASAAGYYWLSLSC